MKWLSNSIPGPAPCLIRLEGPAETQAEADRRYERWLEGKVLGKPMATAEMTVEQLEAYGVVGVYEIPDERPKDPAL